MDDPSQPQPQDKPSGRISPAQESAYAAENECHQDNKLDMFIY
jgi:hypothetical protein